MEHEPHCRFDLKQPCGLYSGTGVCAGHAVVKGMLSVLEDAVAQNTEAAEKLRVALIEMMAACDKCRANGGAVK